MVNDEKYGGGGYGGGGRGGGGYGGGGYGGGGGGWGGGGGGHGGGGGGGCGYRRCCNYGRCYCCRPNHFGDLVETENQGTKVYVINKYGT